MTGAQDEAIVTNQAVHGPEREQTRISCGGGLPFRRDPEDCCAWTACCSAAGNLAARRGGAPRGAPAGGRSEVL